jgi:hypothetical protein
MYLPSAVAKQPEINAAVSEVVSLFAPDVVHIRYDIARDWSGDYLLQLLLPKLPKPSDPAS